MLKNRLSKIVSSERFFDRLLRPLLKTGVPLMKNLRKTAKTVSIALELTVTTYMNQQI